MRGRGEGGRESYFGRELETDIFGKPKFATEYSAALKRYARDSKNGFLPYEVAQQLIREFYLDDPTDPSKEFAKDLRLEVCERFELDDDEADAVKFYSAVGTPLDLFHGVDAWMEIDLGDDRRGRFHVEVTLDATLNASKLREGHKADVIVGDVPAPDSKDYLDWVNRSAEEIYELLSSRLRNEITRRGGAQAK